MSDLEVDEVPASVMADDAKPWRRAIEAGAATVGGKGAVAGAGAQHADRLWGLVPDVIPGVRVGVLVGIRHDGEVPLVVFPGQRGSAAVPARSTVDIHDGHIGGELVLMFEDGDAGRPIIVGCLGCNTGWPAGSQSGQVEIDADGERLVVGAKERLVLRCGKATITLTKEGKVLIQGTYLSSRSSGVNRIKGGSVQLN